MKNIVFGLITSGTVILFAVLFLTLLHKNVRREELEQSLAEAMEVTMQAWSERQRDNADVNVQAGKVCEEKMREEELCDEDALADYMPQALCVQLESDSEVTVKILAADADKGLLSAEVEEEFVYPSGQTGSVSAQRTVIADYEEVIAEEVHTVTFFRTKEDMEAGENVYKTFRIRHGDKLIQPVEPQDESGGKNFREWRDGSDYLSDFSRTVEEDLTYYALFE